MPRRKAAKPSRLQFIPRSVLVGPPEAVDGGGAAGFVFGPYSVKRGGDFSGALWAEWGEGAEEVSRHTMKVASAGDASYWTLVEDVSGDAPGARTRFRVRAGRRGLQLEVLAEELWPEGRLLRNRPDTPEDKRRPLWKDDGVEWFLAEPGNSRRIHLLVNSAGVFEYELKNIDKEAVEGKVDVERKEDAGLLVLRVRIPDLFARVPVVRMQVARNRRVGTAVEGQTWTPMRGDSMPNFSCVAFFYKVLDSLCLIPFINL